jgi:hypothetical protein
MAFGVDTFRTHLDLVGWDLFKTTNGGVGGAGHVTGGEPDFAGRNFLGGDFIWAHAEATDALDNPSPKNLSQLNRLTPFIAPMQAPLLDRQQTTGQSGCLYGRIDGQALCDRIVASVRSGEFDVPGTGFVNVWLCVGPGVPFSVDYWAGWSDQVNTYHMVTSFSFATGVVSRQPFRACVSCAFSAGDDGRFGPGLPVSQALTSSRTLYLGLHTTCYAYWADLASAQPLNWDTFLDVGRPLVWRFSRGLRNTAGLVVNDEFDVDAADPRPQAPKPATFMLTVNQWQPNVPQIRRYGFIKGPPGTAYTGISAAEIHDVGTHPIPQMQDLGGDYTLPGGPVEVIGRYLKTPGHLPSVGRDEAVRLCNASFELFTIWESWNDLAGGEPVGPPGVGILYFHPLIHSGTEDARFAFAHCGDVLHQPPQTPVFFCVDFDAPDPKDPSNLLDPTIAATADLDDRTREIKSRIMRYFELVKAERDAYVQRNPDRYYLIGLYGNGGVNRWAYEQGIVNLFWQSVSSLSTGNTMPNRPWYHANRWQFNREVNLEAAGWKVAGKEIVDGADPDVDWDDGGTWTVSDPLELRLERLERQRLQRLLPFVFPRWMQDLDL